MKIININQINAETVYSKYLEACYERKVKTGIDTNRFKILIKYTYPFGGYGNVQNWIKSLPKSTLIKFYKDLHNENYIDP